MSTTRFFIRRLPVSMLAIFSLALLIFGAGAAQAASLEKDFSSPPDTARPHVYWYWNNGHISREGITADLEGMKRAGIGGVMIFNVGGSFPKGPVRCATPEWRALVKHAVLEAARLGLEVNLNNSPGGWSGSGGPWITPELAMQKLTWSETRLSGGRKIQVRLARPPVTETYQPEYFDPPKPLGYYRDIAVLAFPTPPTEQPQTTSLQTALRLTASDPKFNVQLATDGKEETIASLTAAAGQPAWIQFEAAAPFPARTLHLDFSPGGAAQGGSLLASDDGSHWRKVRAFTSRNGMRITAPFEAAPARFWKVVFEAPGDMTIGVSEAQLSAAYRIEDWTGKAVFDMFGLDKPLPPPTSAKAPADSIIPRERIVNLTSSLKPDGTLAWDAPPGEWTVIRFGYTPTGQLTGTTAAYGAGGLEGDKFNPAALDLHWKYALAPFLDDTAISPHVQAIHQDSYELGAQNWSSRFPEQFRERRGYDLIPWLPVMTGRVVGSLDESERFLWDLRRVICDLIKDNYFGHLADLCHRAGKLFTCEAYHEDQFDNVTVGALADVPMAEVWVGPASVGPYWMKLGASPAHVYGHRIVQCESFTSNKWHGDGDWPMTPWGLKEPGDAILCGGINRLVMHVSAMQPWMNVTPGMTIGYCGQQFHRGNTWWPLAYGWTGYLARCQHLLRQGAFVADVLYSCGENSPAKSLEPGGVTSVPPGYDYDVCDPQAILTRLTVKNGRLVLKDGMSYRLLVLPEGDMMTPALLRKIRELVNAGATVMGPKPTRAPGLAGGPRANDEVRKRADELWGSGRVLPTQPLSPVLAKLGAAPDFAPEKPAPLLYIHRRLGDGRELYFVANHSDGDWEVRCKFRVAGRQPELWDPVTGAIRPLPEFTQEAEQTAVALKFAPRQSFFIVFAISPAKSAKAKSAKITKNFCDLQPAVDLAGSWEVTFDPKWGGPAKPVTFAKLEDWTRRPEPGIRYYSGTALYRKRFDLPPSIRRGAPLILDLGTIKDMAAVRLNGHDLGVVWCAPWQVEITGAVKPSGNQLEVTVVNTWVNRMIGDEQLPLDYERNDDGSIVALPEWLLRHTPRPSGRFTFSTLAPFKRGDPLRPAGLLGPVTIQEAREGI